MAGRETSRSGESLYAILEVAQSASLEDIKHSYRRLALRYHPDKNPGDPEAAERFRNVNRAYNILSDQKKRKIYDDLGPVGIMIIEEMEKSNIDPRFIANYARIKCLLLCCGVVTCCYCCLCCCCCCNCCCGKCAPDPARRADYQTFRQDESPQADVVTERPAPRIVKLKVTRQPVGGTNRVVATPSQQTTTSYGVVNRQQATETEIGVVVTEQPTKNKNEFMTPHNIPITEQPTSILNRVVVNRAQQTATSYGVVTEQPVSTSNEIVITKKPTDTINGIIKTPHPTRIINNVAFSQQPISTTTEVATTQHISTENTFDALHKPFLSKSKGFFEKPASTIH